MQRAFAALGIGAAFVIACITVLALLLYRDVAIRIGQWHLENLAAVLVEQTSHAVKDIDLMLSETVEDYLRWHADPRSFPVSELHRRMAERAAQLAQVRAMHATDSTGAAVVVSGAHPPPAVNYSDRDYFVALRDGDHTGLHVGETVQDRITLETTYTFSRRITGPAAEFLGVTASAINGAYFRNLYGTLNLGSAGRVLLFRRDGTLLTTYPAEPGAIGRSFAQHALFSSHLGRSENGVITAPAFLHDAPRYIAYRSVRGYPLVVAVSSAHEDVLGAWRQQAWQIGVGALLAVAFSVFLGFWLARQFRARETLAGELRASEEKLRDSEARLNGIIESAMDAIVTIDASHDIVLFNSSAERIFGAPRSEAIGRPLDRFIPERFRSAHRQHIDRFGATGVTMRHMGMRAVLYGLRASGEEFPIDASISQATVDGRRFYTVILRDISARVRAEEALARSHRELRELYARMHDVREGERTRIARELHDELAQWLTALKMDISWLAARLPQEPPALAARTDRMKDVVDTTVASVRRIAADLRPVMLDDLGMVPALEGLLHEFSQRTGIVIGFDVADRDIEFRDPLATAVYRMVQEALTNVARHAQASEVSVQILVDVDTLVVTVRDNGRGFDPSRQSAGRSFGLLGIRERAQTLGGKATITSSPGGGTTVRIEIPLRAQAAGEERRA